MSSFHVERRRLLTSDCAREAHGWQTCGRPALLNSALAQCAGARKERRRQSVMLEARLYAITPWSI